MRLTITRDSLQFGVASTSEIVPTRTTLPVLSNVLIEAGEGRVRFQATDLNTVVILDVPADVEEEGAISVPAKKLQEIAKALPEQPVRITAQGERFALTCGRASFQLNALPKEEVPLVATVTFAQPWRIRSGMLTELIRQTSFAAATDENRPILNGVLWQLRAEHMRMVATNGHRLAMATIALEESAEERSVEPDVIVAPRALGMIERLFGPLDEIEIAQNGHYLGFRSERAELHTLLLEGPYPNYEQVLPKDHPLMATVDRAAFAQAVRRMAVVASDQTHRVEITFDEGRAGLEVETPDLGRGSEELDVDFGAPRIRMPFNAHYLLELLRYLPTDEVRIRMRAPNRAITIEPVWEGDDHAEYLYLVVPLHNGEAEGLEVPETPEESAEGA